MDFFKLTSHDLENLGPQRSIIFIQSLLWAEAQRVHIPLNEINISSNIFAADGGIDATINSEISSPVLRQGFTGYQIKTGKSFNPNNKSDIKKELFGRKKVSKENLANMVRKCLDERGNYILICFGYDLTSEQVEDSKNSIKNYLSECGYQNAKIEVWSQNNLISFTGNFPSIIFDYKNISMQFQTYKSWRDAEMQRHYVYDEDQQQIIRNIRGEIRKTSETIHIRILGEPGVGKTRLIYEALREVDLMPVVIYTSAVKFKDSDLMYRLLMPDNKYFVILVIDECDKENRTYLWDKLKFGSNNLKIISIFNEYEEPVGDLKYFIAPNLRGASIINIIENYSIPYYSAERWALYCGGSPRVAHIIGENILADRSLLSNPSTTEVWERYLYGSETRNSNSAFERKTVLLYIALFKKFGFGGKFIKESDCIASLVQEVEPNITKSKFNQIIQELKSRKILQGEYTLYITPKALHIKLWIDWWNNYGYHFNFDEFQKKLVPSLFAWYFEMFKYASESNLANEKVKELLGLTGPFQTSELLKTKIGGNFFLALTEADPKSALSCLMKTIYYWNKNELLNLKESRRDLVWALERIVIWKELFQDGAKLLLKLAEAENENYSNNATGIFIELFMPVGGKASPTEASINDRLPLLIEVTNSNDPTIRSIGYSAADAALSRQHIGRLIGAEYQGLRKEPILWRPNSNEEVYNYFRNLWNFLLQKLDTVEDSEKKILIDILFKNARGVAVIDELNELVLDTFKEFKEYNFVDKKELLSTIVRVLHFEGKKFSTEVRKKWELLKEEVSGTDYKALLRRFLVIDLIEDKYDEEGNRINIVEQSIKELAEQSFSNKEMFFEEIDWIIKEEGINSFLFGYELGKLDTDFSFLDRILNSAIKTEKKQNLFLLGGYFKALFEKDILLWEKTIERLSSQKEFSPIIFEIIIRSGISDKIVSTLKKLKENKIIILNEFRQLIYGNLIQRISYTAFIYLLDYILNDDDSSAGPVAVSLTNHYFIGIDNKVSPLISESLLFKLLTHNSFLMYDRNIYDPMDEYYWSQLAEILIKKYPSSSQNLASFIIENFGTQRSIFGSSLSHTNKIIDLIFKKDPIGIWNIIKKYLGPPIDDRAFSLRDWLRGGDFHSTPEGLINFIPFSEISKWIDEDIENRAWNVAGFVTPNLFKETDKQCVAREILVKYGNRQDVKDELFANFSTEGWSGPASLHYISKRTGLLKYKELETDKKVLNWIDEYILELDERIEIAKNEEERRY